MNSSTETCCAILTTCVTHHGAITCDIDTVTTIRSGCATDDCDVERARDTVTPVKTGPAIVNDAVTPHAETTPTVVASKAPKYIGFVSREALSTIAAGTATADSSGEAEAHSRARVTASRALPEAVVAASDESITTVQPRRTFREGGSSFAFDTMRLVGFGCTGAYDCPVARPQAHTAIAEDPQTFELTVGSVERIHTVPAPVAQRAVFDHYILPRAAGKDAIARSPAQRMAHQVQFHVVCSDRDTTTGGSDVLGQVIRSCLIDGQRQVSGPNTNPRAESAGERN